MKKLRCEFCNVEVIVDDLCDACEDLVEGASIKNEQNFLRIGLPYDEEKTKKYADNLTESHKKFWAEVKDKNNNTGDEFFKRVGNGYTMRKDMPRSYVFEIRTGRKTRNKIGRGKVNSKGLNGKIMAREKGSLVDRFFELKGLE